MEVGEINRYIMYELHDKLTFVDESLALKDFFKKIFYIISFGKLWCLGLVSVEFLACMWNFRWYDRCPIILSFECSNQYQYTQWVQYADHQIIWAPIILRPIWR